MIYVFLADGFEECEAVAPIDMLRRAGCEVIIVKIGVWDNYARGSHDINIVPDFKERELPDILAGIEMIVLPGGAAGVETLFNSDFVRRNIDYCIGRKIRIGAICAAPSVLARRGYLRDIRATAYPSFRHYLTEGGAILEETEKVVTDGIFTTAAGAGVSVEFGLELVRLLKGENKAKEIAEQILF